MTLNRYDKFLLGFLFKKQLGVRVRLDGCIIAQDISLGRGCSAKAPIENGEHIKRGEKRRGDRCNVAVETLLPENISFIA